MYQQSSGEPLATNREETMRTRWESCTALIRIEGRGLVRCWQPPRGRDAEGGARCEEHAAALVRGRGIETLHAGFSEVPTSTRCGIARTALLNGEGGR